jgi:FkbM family methyltransferase
MRWLARTVVRQFYKRIARRDHFMDLPTGERLCLPVQDHFASEAYITDADVDWGSERLLFSLLDKTGVFLDIGAHIGYYSLYMRPRVAAVYAFEPDPRMRPYLEKNLTDKRDIHILRCAVGGAAGRAGFVLEGSAELSHLSNGPVTGKQEVIEVDVVTVDTFVRSRGLFVEAIKIDVQGFDTQVIAGALETLKSQQPVVLTEARPDRVLFDLACQASYTVFAFVRDPRTRQRAFARLTKRPPGDTKMLFLVPDRMLSRISPHVGAL